MFSSYRIFCHEINFWSVKSSFSHTLFKFDLSFFSNIANFTHLSGLVCGALIGYAVLHTAKRMPAIVAVALLTLASFVPLFWMPWSPWWTNYKAFQAHYEHENLEEAIAWYRKALELDPSDVEWTESQLAVAEARLAHLEAAESSRT